ncbi:MAG: hypothetical protein NTX61_11370 [Bacteroidetes bacterium]|nr:hypothetical protein [Bacteroidota bacterium]
MKKIISWGIVLLCFSQIVLAQNASDALRYSRIFYSGTARYQGMAGAFGAVGGDFSVLVTNPAGIGLFRSTEVTLTPSLWINHATSLYNNTNSTDNNANVNIGNVGIIFAIKPHEKSNSDGIQNFNLGIGFNHQNNFSSHVFMGGQNNSSSLMTNFVNELNTFPGGITPGMISDTYPFDIGPAYDANLIVYDSASGKYWCDAPHGGVFQKESVNTSGSINEFDISLGGNFNDKLYFGATIGLPSINFTEKTQYSEIRSDTAKVHEFRQLIYDQYLNTTGFGINLKVGLIYRPVYWLRMGAAIHTPTYYGNMKDSWHSSFSSEFDSAQWNQSVTSPDGYYEYKLTTPFRAIGGLAFTIGDFGLISGEYEYVNYGQARFHEDGSSDTSVNRQIKNSFISPVNVRLGTEWRIQNFRIRGGFGYYGSPYKAGINKGEMMVISGGLGYRGKHYFVDLAYSWYQTKEDYYFYDPILVNPSHNTLTNHNISATFGIRF